MRLFTTQITESFILRLSVVLTLMVVGLITLLYRDVWMLPPYWDSITGVFREAFWLIDNRWNYYDFAMVESGYKFGGARTYYFSFYPSLISFLYLIFDPSFVFLLLRGLNLLALIGIIIGISRVAKADNLPTGALIIIAIFALSFPIFLSQLLALNMELLLALAAVQAFSSYHRNRLVPCFLWLLLGVLSKGSGALAAVAILLYDLSRFVFLGRKDISRVFLLSIPTLVYAGFSLLEGKIFYQGGGDGQFRLGLIGTNWKELFSVIKFFSTSLDLIFFILIFIVVGLTIVFSLKKAAQAPHHFINLSLIYISVWIVCCLFYSPSLPRYLACCIFPLSYIAIFAARYLKFAALNALIFVVAAFNISNHSGNFYQSLNLGPFSNDGMYYDSSLNYVDAIRRDITSSEFISSISSGPITIGWPLSIVLSDARYGYVRSPLTNLVDYGKSRADIPKSYVDSGYYFAQNNIWSPVVGRCTEPDELKQTVVNGLNPYFLCKIYLGDNLFLSRAF